MNIVLITVCVIVWWYIGYRSFIFWWTHDFDYKQSEVPIAYGMGVFGPIAFLIGYLVHGVAGGKKILKAKRK